MIKNIKPETHKNSDLSKANYQRVLNSALRILTGRDHSEYELNQKLTQRGFAPEDIEKVILECERLDYLNDERTARGYIRQLITRGYGEKRIRLEMKKKGLWGERLQNILSEAVSISDEQKGAERILKKNIRRFERETDPKSRRGKIYRFLYARGYSPETITKLVNESGLLR